MKYTINGKEYTEFDINMKCAELLGHIIASFQSKDFIFVRVGEDESEKNHKVDYARDAADTWPIIEKCWDELMVVHMTIDYVSNWQDIMDQHNCTKLVAACICFIEINEEL